MIRKIFHFFVKNYPMSTYTVTYTSRQSDWNPSDNDYTISEPLGTYNTYEDAMNKLNDHIKIFNDNWIAYISNDLKRQNIDWNQIINLKYYPQEIEFNPGTFVTGFIIDDNTVVNGFIRSNHYTDIISSSICHTKGSNGFNGSHLIRIVRDVWLDESNRLQDDDCDESYIIIEIETK